LHAVSESRSGKTSGDQVRRLSAIAVSGVIAVAAFSCFAQLSGLAQAASPSRNGVIAFDSNRDGHYEIYTVTVTGGHLRRLTRTAAGVSNFAPAFSGDGRRVVFDSNRLGNYEIYAMNADGSGLSRLTRTAPTVSNFLPHFFADGKRIVFLSDRTGHNEVYVMRANGSAVRQLTHTSAGIDNSRPMSHRTASTSCSLGRTPVTTRSSLSAPAPASQRLAVGR
jgi:Tol biopolymer transport system component